MDFEFNRKFNLLLGVSVYLPDFYEKSPKILKFLWRLYADLGLIGMTAFVFVFAGTVALNYDNIAIICTSGGAGLFIFQIPFKIAVFQAYDEIFKNMLSNILETSIMLSRNPLKNDEFPQIFQKFYKRMKIITPVKAAVEFVSLTSLMVFYLIKGLYFDKMEERKLPAPMWTPYDATETNFYVFSLVVETFACAGALLRNTAMDMLYCTILMTLSLQLKFAKKLLKEILEEYEEMRKNVEERRCIKDLENKLRWWTEMHQKILRSTTDMKKISSPYLGYLYFTMMSEFFLVGTVSTSATAWNPVQKYLSVAIIMLNIFQLYIISTIGDSLTEDGLEATDAGFDITLLHSSAFLRKNYLFTIMRGKQPILLKAAQISPLSAQTFGKLARVTFSYFITMLQVRQEYGAHTGF